MAETRLAALRSQIIFIIFLIQLILSRKIITSKNIREYEDLLAGHNFFRIHKSYIINMGEILKYVRGEGGYVVMSDNTAIDVSRRRKEEFLKMLDKA